MNIQVTPHTITLTRTTSINAGEYNITPCVFEFSEEYSNLTKEAVFSTCSTTVKTAILNNQCIIPFEVLQEPGNVLIGVFGYDTEDDELILRYSPKPMYFNVVNGSFKEGNDPDLPAPTEWELVLEQINEAIEKTNNLNITVEKTDHITTITLTKKDGTPEEVKILDGVDGVSLENIEIVNRNLKVTYGGETENLGQVAPNIQVGTTTTGLPNTNASVVNVGTDLNPILNFTIPKGEAGAIKMLIVDELPTTGEQDTIYLVPLENPTEEGNNYAEYVYINGEWELLGKIGVQVDLTDYYTKTETNTLLNDKVGFTDYASASKGGVVKANVFGYMINQNGQPYANIISYNDYPGTNNNTFIGKGTLENVITGKDLTTKSYVDGLVGDINTALDTINGEVI